MLWSCSATGPTGGVSTDSKFEAAAPKSATAAGGLPSPFSGSVESQLQQALAKIKELEAELAAKK